MIRFAKPALALLAALSLAACGSSDAGLDPAFAGTWTGMMRIKADGILIIDDTVQMTVTVSGSSATVTPVCPDSPNESLTATGTGGSAAWAGSLACPTFKYLSTCDVAFTVRTAAIALGNGNASLTAFESGTATATGDCGIVAPTTPLTVEFAGAR